MCKQLWMGMELQPLYNGMVCSPAVTQQAFCRLSKSGSTRAMVTGCRWFHMPIHCIWSGSYIYVCAPHWCASSFGWVWSLIHFIILWFVAQQVPKLSADGKNLGQQGPWSRVADGSICPSTAYEVAYSPFLCSTLAPHWCASSFGWVWSLIHFIMVWFVAQQLPKLSADCQNLSQQGPW